MSVRDFARVGWFWLQRGNWDGVQLLPEATFDAYVRAQVPSSLPRIGGSSPIDYLGIGTFGGGNDQTALGPGRLGFMWWFNPERGAWPDAPPDTFQANGRWNETSVTVIPSRGLVAVWRGGIEANPALFDGPMNTILGELVAAAPLSVPMLPWAQGLGGAVVLGAVAGRGLRRVARARA